MAPCTIPGLGVESGAVGDVGGLVSLFDEAEFSCPGVRLVLLGL
jgi:hypothetical protein